MAKLSIFVTAFALLSTAAAQCGSGTPNAKVTGSGSSFTATKGSSTVYTGSDYRAAIQAAVDSISQSDSYFDSSHDTYLIADPRAKS